MPPYRFGFAVKLVGGGGLRSADTRRWQNGPHLSRSLEHLHAVFDYLERIDVRMFRLSSGTVPYGTHPDLPHLDYRRQIDACGAALAGLGARAERLGLRLSTHPGQYSVLNSVDDEVRRKAIADVEQDALLLDALGAGPQAVVVIHVGSREGGLERWERSWSELSDRARARLAVEHDERSFHLGHALELHRRTGVRVIFDLHHHRCLAAPGLEDVAAALAAAAATWPRGIRPKAHVSSARTELRRVGAGTRARTVPPALEQHADFVTPWDAVTLLEAAAGPVDVMLEAKAKDVALLWLRRQLQRVRPDVAAAEERGAAPRPAARSRAA